MIVTPVLMICDHCDSACPGTRSVSEYTAWPVGYSVELYNKDRYGFCLQGLAVGMRTGTQAVRCIAALTPRKDKCPALLAGLRRTVGCQHVADSGNGGRGPSSVSRGGYDTRGGVSRPPIGRTRYPPFGHAGRRMPPVAAEAAYISGFVDCSAWRCTCQGFSDRFGTRKGTWGRAPETAKRWWGNGESGDGPSCATWPGRFV